MTLKELALNVVTRGNYGRRQRLEQAQAAQRLGKQIASLDFHLEGMPTEEFPLFARENQSVAPKMTFPWLDVPEE
ncbi:MAG TPA: hypothetical protein VF189_03120 [Patescibacteria group bacterium]